MQVKVCGLKDFENIQKIAELDTDFVGFIFYNDSPRNFLLTEEIRGEIRRFKNKKVGVFVDGKWDYIRKVIHSLKLDYVQLHGDESPEFAREISAHCKVIKSFSITDKFDFSMCKLFKVADLFLFDTKGKSKGGTGQKFDWTLLNQYQEEIPFLLSGGIGPEDLSEIAKIEHSKFVGVDINSKFEIKPGLKKVELVQTFIDQIKSTDRKGIEQGYYGEFGGAYIPELLYQPIEELKVAFTEAQSDSQFQNQFKDLLRDYAGRPTPLYYSIKLSQLHQADIFLKREDLNHTGAHKINNTIGQILLAKRMGKRRIIAETGAGQHGVATATVCALLGMQCIVYMGAVDMERQQPNVSRMKLLGAEVRPANSGSKTLKDATNEAIRDWINHPNSFYLIGSVVGPHPYPQMVAYFQSIISEEIRSELIRKTGKPNPDMVIACVGGGSNAAGAFYHYLEEDEVDLVLVEAAGLGLNSGKSAATSVLGTIGIIHGSKTLMMQDEMGQIIEPYSISAGLDYPGIGPLHAHLIRSGRGKTVTITDDEALQAGMELTKNEGILPALESAHALAALGKMNLKEKTVVVNLSGRGDKDLAAYLKQQQKLEGYEIEG